MPLSWPLVLRSRTRNPELRNFTKSGGRTGAGREQRVFSDSGFWEIAVDRIKVTEPEERLAYKAMIAKLRQGETILVRLCDADKADADGPVTLQASGALRATQLQLAGSAAALEPGHHITIGQRLHRVTDVLGETSANIGLVNAISGSAAWNDADVWVDEPQVVLTIKILPPLRQAVASGAAVELNEIVCVCELADMNDGDLDLDLGRHGFPSITFREAI